MSSINNTPCRTAMSNLEVLLRSYNHDGSDPVESLFDNAFHSNVRLDLNGQSYKRDFLLYQQTQNFARRRKVEEISMEVLDNTHFRYTFQIEEDCCDSDFEESDSESDDESSSSMSCSISSTSSLSSTYHSLATVKNGKIVKIKPMTGLAYTDLFVSNIHYANNEVAEDESSSSSSETKSRKPSGSRIFARRLLRGLIPRRISSAA